MTGRCCLGSAPSIGRSVWNHGGPNQFVAVVLNDVDIFTPGNNKDFDLFPPAAGRAREPGGIRLRGLNDQGLQPDFRGGWRRGIRAAPCESDTSPIPEQRSRDLARPATRSMRVSFTGQPIDTTWVTQLPGGSKTATWLPPNKSFRCEYVARQIAVKAKYKLWVTQAERDAIAGILATCK